MSSQIKIWHKILIVGAILVLVIAFGAEKLSEKTREQETLKSLNLYLELRHSILFDFLKSMGTEVRSASTNHLVPASAESLSLDWRHLSPNERSFFAASYAKKNDTVFLAKYSKAQEQYMRDHDLFESYSKKFIEHFGYYDLFLIDLNGDVVYTFAKEKDFGTNLNDGPYNKTALAEVFHRALNLSVEDIVNNKEVLIFSDFESYAPSNGEPAAFCAYPIEKNGKTIGVLALQIPTEYLNKMMQFTAGMGKTGETYIVGNDKLMRSQSRFTHEQTALKKTVDTESVRLGLLGKKGSIVTKDYRSTPVLSAFAPIDFGGHLWVVVAEMDVAEAIGGMRQWTILVSALGLLAVGLVSLIYRNKLH